MSTEHPGGIEALAPVLDTTELTGAPSSLMAAAHPLASVTSVEHRPTPRAATAPSIDLDMRVVHGHSSKPLYGALGGDSEF